MPWPTSVDMVRESGSSPEWYPAGREQCQSSQRRAAGTWVGQWTTSAYLPVPHESTLDTKPLYGGLPTMDWKTPSAIVDRQMLPRQTKRTDTWSGILGDGPSAPRRAGGRAAILGDGLAKVGLGRRGAIAEYSAVASLLARSAITHPRGEATHVSARRECASSPPACQWSRRVHHHVAGHTIHVSTAC